MTKNTRQKLAAYWQGFLESMAAVPVPGCPRRYAIDTVAGRLEMILYDARDHRSSPWLACRFDDVDRAMSMLGEFRVAKFSGKYNLTLSADQSAEQAFRDIGNHIGRVLSLWTPPHEQGVSK